MNKINSLRTNETKFLFLDGIRGIAAVYVMVGHARWLLWEGYQSYLSHPDSYSWINKSMMYVFSLFRWGHEFVLLFFVLSGFLIHLGYAAKLTKDAKAKLNFRQYFWKRTKRIYPPFLLAILLAFVLDTLGKSNGFSLYFGETTYASINTHLGNKIHDGQTLLGNIFFSI